MSITRAIPKRKLDQMAKSKKALEDYLKKGGKITEIPEGTITEAHNMKYKYRNARKEKKVPEE
jgi:hypothetical protein|tara:strand:+ start:1741 stop:1929 length:189 start_codon:yes stop_codon:yes gene_type:complete